MSSSCKSELKKANIFAGKISASCSGIHQAANVSPVFRAAKEKLRKVTPEQANIASPRLYTTIPLAISECEKKFNIIVPPDRRGKIVDAIAAIV